MDSSQRSPYVQLSSPELSTTAAAKSWSTLFAVHFVQLYALSLKNILLLYRAPSTCLALILSPATVVLLLYIASYYVSNFNSNESVPHTPISVPFSKCQVLNVFGNPATGRSCYSIGYAPLNAFTTQIMQTIIKESNLDINNDLIGFSDDNTMYNYMASNLGSVDVAIVFQSTHPDKVVGYVSPYQVRYTLMYNQSSYNDNYITNNYYYDSSIVYSNTAYLRALTLQYRLESTLVNAITANISRDYPLPGYKPVPLTSGLGQFEIQIIQQSNYVGQYQYYNAPSTNQYTDPVTYLGGATVLVACVIILVLIIVMFIAQEKQEKLLASIRMNGLNESNYWWSYLLLFTFTSMLAALIATIVGKLTGLQIYQYVDFSIHFISLWLFLISMCALAVLFATLVTKTRWVNLLIFFTLGAAVSSVSVLIAIGNVNIAFIPINIGLTMLLDACPFVLYSKIWNDMAIHSSILPVSNYSVPISVVETSWWPTTTTAGYTIYAQQTMHWNDIYNQEMIPPMSGGCNYFDYACCNYNQAYQQNNPYRSVPTCYLYIQSSSTSMLCMLLMTFVYMIIAWWLAQVAERDLGGNKPAFFCFYPSYYGFRPKQERAIDGDTFKREQQKSLEDGSIRTVKLSKAFKDQTAVKELSLNMEKNQCFVLLGSNGAGKTTVINMLTGLFAPTFGEAFVMGLDIKEDMSRIQSLMGICTQEDLLWPSLSVIEHMYTFAALRGVAWKDQTKVCQEKLNLVNLWADRFKFTSELSGGMKRRLSIAMAMVGDPSVVFLDEPSTGMDPLHKAEVWGAISLIKQNRVVVLTTHSMEEADYLADKIGLISMGRLRALGSSLFLKNTYGKGYQLKLTVHPKHISQIEQAVKKYLLGAEVVGTEGGSITIGMRRSQLKNVPLLFQFIEKEQSKQDYQILHPDFSSAQSDPSICQSGSHENQMLREWSISNSTLEEVFLRLCAREKAPNEEIEGDSLIREKEAALENELEGMCGICKVRPVALVTVYTASGLELLLPNLICQQCGNGSRLTDGSNSNGNGNSTAVITADSTQNGAGASDEEKKEDAAPIEWSLFPEPNPGGPLDSSINVYPKVESSVPLNVSINTSSPQANIQESVGKHLPSARNQIFAIIKKNAALVKTEWISWIIRVIFLALFNGLLLGLIYSSTLNTPYCPNGIPGNWLNGPSPCDVQAAVGRLFCPLLNQTTVSCSMTGYTPNAYDYLQYNIATNQYYYTSSFNSSTNSYPYNVLDYWFQGSYGKMYTAFTDSKQAGDTSFNYYDTGNGIAQLGTTIVNITDWSGKNQDPATIIYNNQVFLLNNYGALTNQYPQCALNYFGIYYYFFNDSSRDLATSSRLFGRSIFPDLVFSLLQSKIATPDNPTSSMGLRLYTYVSEYGMFLPSIAAADCTAQSLFYTTGVSQNVPYSMHKLSNSLLYTSIRASSNYIAANSSQYFTIWKAPNSPGIFGSVYPIPPVPFTPALSSFGYFAGMGFLTCISIMLLPYFTDRILYEKEKNLFHMQRISGMRSSNYWIANYICDSVIMLIWSSIGIVIGYLVGTVIYTSASPLLYISLLIIWNHAQISCAWLFAYFFTSRRIAAIVLYLFIFIMIGVGETLQITTFPSYLMIFPPIAFLQALSLIINTGGTAEQLMLGTSLSNALIMCLLTSTIVMVIALYLHTSRYKGWFFFLEWFANLESIKAEKLNNGNGNNLNAQLIPSNLVENDSTEDEDVRLERDRIEAQAIDSKFSTIFIRALTKQYSVRGIIYAKLKEWVMGKENSNTKDMIGGGKSYVNAVDGIWMGIEAGSCFGLLGPNGAGKSTTLSILSGLFPPSTGSARLCGYDVRTQLPLVYTILGICPQEEFLYDDLTVRQHLLFYARLKGVDSASERALVSKLAEMVELDGDPFDKRASTLSGGLKRRLSIAISLIGNPKVWLLDEPTTGLSPEARREIWAIITKQKAVGRSIVITTHSMEEADTLTDRIGIVCKGKLQCIGSQAHLKSKYGDGFKLTLNMTEEEYFVINPHQPLALQQQLMIQSIQDIIRISDPIEQTNKMNIIPHATKVVYWVSTQIYKGAILFSVSGKKVTFLLPTTTASNSGQSASASAAANLPEILGVFNRMEEQKGKLLSQWKVQEWGLSHASLEEVFVNIVRQTEAKE